MIQSASYSSGVSPIIRGKAPLILSELKKAKSVLLCCHPSPDADSIGSCLAMKFVIESMGKRATVIRGDSEISLAFMHFPGASDILKKNFFEVDLADFDLFIILDVNGLDRVSLLNKIVIPPTLNTVMIDHHQPKPEFAAVSLVETTYPATCQILFDLFTEWGIDIDRNIASNLFMGIYTDTGGFKYSGTTSHTYEVASYLVKIIPNFPLLISDMENTEAPESIAFIGKAFSSVKTYNGGRIALSSISYADFKALDIGDIGLRVSNISSMLRVVVGWDVVGALTEIEPGKVKCSFRSKDGEKFNVSLLAQTLGGGGHKSAAGVMIEAPLEEAEKMIVAKAKELYNL